MHTCNYPYIYTRGKWYTCTSITGHSSVRDSPGCGHMEGKYPDNVECVQREIKDSTLIPADYDPDPQCVPLPSSALTKPRRDDLPIIITLYAFLAF